MRHYSRKSFARSTFEWFLCWRAGSRAADLRLGFTLAITRRLDAEAGEVLVGMQAGWQPAEPLVLAKLTAGGSASDFLPPFFKPRAHLLHIGPQVAPIFANPIPIHRRWMAAGSEGGSPFPAHRVVSASTRYGEEHAENHSAQDGLSAIFV